MKKPPTAIDINRVLTFVANTNDEDEKFLGGLWIEKFYDYRDKYGEREPSGRIRATQAVKEKIAKPKSGSVIHLTGSRAASPATTAPLTITANDIPLVNAKSQKGTYYYFANSY